MLLSRLVTLFAGLTPQSIFSSHHARPTIYLIRHGEKDHHQLVGLNDNGRIRAHCLTHVFGPNSPYKIGYILAPAPEPEGIHDRSFRTVTPLATALNLTVDTSCGQYEPECAAEMVKAYTGPGNILVCWQHGALKIIMEELGGQDIPSYPDDRNDLMWTASRDWTGLLDVQSECCPELDDC